MADTIRVGIIGAGGNTRSKHIPGLQAIDGVEVVGVCNRSVESSQRVVDEFGLSQVYENWWDVTDADDLDAVVIGTWPYTHERMTVRGLNHDKHVMVEARMARNLTEAKSMVAASQANPHLVAQIVPSPMTLGVDNTIKRLIREGYLGEIQAIEARTGNQFIDPDAPMHWRENFDYSGLNIMGMGIWYEAVLRWVGEATSVSAMGKTFTPMRRGEDGNMHSTKIPDYINIHGEMACGAQMQMTFSTVTGLAEPNMVTLYGSDGTLRFMGGNLYGGQRDSSELKQIEVPAEEASGWRVEEEFINAIRGEEEITHTDFRTGLKYMAFTEAVTRSMQQRCVVSI